MPVHELKQYDVDMKILSEDTPDEAEQYKQEYSTLEVAEEGASTPKPPAPKKSKQRRFWHSKIFRWIVLPLLIVSMLAGLLLAIRATQKPDTTITINTQSLDNGTLNQLTGDADGEVRQQLTISPETLFKDSIIVQGSADIRQNLDVGGVLTVSGASNLQGPASIGGELTVGGSTAIGGNLSVTGSITAASLAVGSISISNINVSSDITFEGHLIPSGASPSSRPSVAASGGSVTVSGNDTAGTITITVGSGSVLAGEMAIITFNKAFARTPKVQLTPINSAASGIRYFATRSATFFTIETSTAPSNGTSYVFDYLVTQ